MNNYPKEFLDYLNSVKAKRPQTMIQHILKHGSINSEEIQTLYGYDHPPRAIRDVRELGIPVVTYRVNGPNGKSIAAYKFGDPKDFKNPLSKQSGRTALSKKLKKSLIDKYGARCFIYQEKIDESLLQVDHRIPYEIGGEHSEDDLSYFMLLSPSANRAKSWTCEHCPNWDKKDVGMCKKCFWAYPENYDHIAGKPEKIINLRYDQTDIFEYDKIELLAKESNLSISLFVKKIILDYLNSNLKINH